MTSGEGSLGVSFLICAVGMITSPSAYGCCGPEGKDLLKPSLSFKTRSGSQLFSLLPCLPHPLPPALSGAVHTDEYAGVGVAPG